MNNTRPCAVEPQREKSQGDNASQIGSAHGAARSYFDIIKSAMVAVGIISISACVNPYIVTTPKVFPARPNGAFACFKDNGDALSPFSPPPPLTGRDLSGFVTKSLSMTNDRCRAQCAAQGFVFAGTQAGAFCFCGNTFGQFGVASACAAECRGSLGEICGGPNANSVSLSAPIVPPPPSNGGQCVFDISGLGYRHFEIQRWEVSGSSTVIANRTTYPMNWSTKGDGDYQVLAVNPGPIPPPSTQLDVTVWHIDETGSTQYVSTVAADGHLVAGPDNNVTYNVTIANPGFKETQDQWINGVHQTPKSSTSLWNEFQYPVTNVPAVPTVSTIVDMKTFPADAGHKYGYDQPADASGTVTCTWTVTR